MEYTFEPVNVPQVLLFAFAIPLVACGGRPPVPVQLTKKVVFIGDSITWCWSNALPQCPSAPGLPYPNAINAGISGATLEEMDARFSSDVLALHPDIVVIEGGTDDLFFNHPVSAMQAAMVDLVQQAQAAHIAVIMGTIPPTSAPNAPDYQSREDAFNSWLMSNFPSAKHADYFAAMSDGSGLPLPGLLQDGLHPTGAGFQVMDGVVFPLLTH